MPPTAPIKSPSVPLTELKSDEVVPSWQPSESHPVLEYEGAASASTPELIKVTRKKKRTTTGGKKKRPKDEDGAALSMS